MNSIFISHHPIDVEKAKKVATALRQISSLSEDNISYQETIRPGRNIDADTFDSIQRAHIIIVIPSSIYLAQCKQEILWVKESDSFKKGRVLPIPFSDSLWKEVFPGIMPLPRQAWFDNIPFGQNMLHQIVVEVNSLLKISTTLSNRYSPLMIARADSNSVESTQDHFDRSFFIKLNPDEILVPIQGDSMYPKFMEGDYVICIPVGREDIITLKSGKKKTYVIRTKRDGTLLKYIGDTHPNHIELVSENPTHSNIVLEEDEIDKVFLVVSSFKKRDED